MPDERRHNSDLDEAVLIGLDQLSQTLEVMAKVVSRLKTQLASQSTDQNARHNRRSTDVVDVKEISQVH